MTFHIRFHQARSIFFFCFFILLFQLSFSQKRDEPLIVDHSCLDISRIPVRWIDSIKTNCRLHYAHTSHGMQLLYGIDRLMRQNSSYQFSIGSGKLPTDNGTFCIFEGQENLSYVYDDYWYTAKGMNLTRDVLNHNPTINYSLYCWCTHLNTSPESFVQAYFDSLAKLESEFPNVTFIYMTGNAQAWSGHHTYNNNSGHGDPAGYNRQKNNELIRKYCRENNKVLFDFGDIDCWYNGEEAFSEYNGNIFQREHSHYNIDEVAHTSYENCDNKGKAIWWMFARLAGWRDESIVPVKMSQLEALQLNENSILVKWTTESEINCVGFHIWRSQSRRGPYLRVTDRYIPGNGTSVVKNQYSYLDTDLISKVTYWYKIEEIARDGSNEFWGPVGVFREQPLSFKLFQNFPNPFNPTTQISFQLLENSRVLLQIFNLSGEEIVTLADEIKSGGFYSMDWNGKNKKGIRVPAGIYFGRLKANQFYDVIKLILID